MAPPVQKILRSTITSVWGGAQEPQSGFLDGGVGRGGAGGVVQYFDKVVDVPVVWVFFVFFRGGRAAFWTRLLTSPLLSLLGFVFFGVKGRR